MKKQSRIRGFIMLLGMMVSLAMSNAYAQTVGEAAPDFEVDLLGGGTFKLADQKGKVVFLFFFGNTCPSCKAVGPTVESSIYQAYKDNSDFVALGLDTWDSSSGVNSVTGFKNSTGITFPLALKAGSVAADYVTSYDHLAVIDRDGVLAHKGSNGAANDVNNAIKAIDESLMAAGIFSRPALESGLKIYPVPANDLIHFESEEAMGQISIYDAAGKLVLVENHESRQGVFTHAFSVGSLDLGLYYYQVQKSDGPVSGKLIIQR